MVGRDGIDQPATARIVEMRRLSGDTTLFRLLPEVPGGIAFTPGQFVQLSVPAGGEAPISLAGELGADGLLELCVRKAGHVTSMLHDKRPGGVVAIRGPFGTGFPVAEMARKDVLLLAGGLGIAPLRSLLLYLLRHRESYCSITLMYGAREPAAMLFREELVELAAKGDFRLFLTVDFVSEELPEGLVCNIGLLPALLRGGSFAAASTYAAVCGPPTLYSCTIDELEAMGFSDRQIFVSLERRMKCGQGRCCHCAVGQFLCCTDGPVFRYSDIRNIPGAI